MFNKSTKNINYLNDSIKKSDSTMSFWLGLKLLLWKNWILRKRNKLRTITEVVWPILMILFVVLLHQVGEKRIIPNCSFKAKAMPTAGEVLFLQTFFCALNNTCDTEKNTRRPSFDSSVVTNLGEAILEAFNLTSQKPTKLLNNNELPLQLKNWIKDILIVESVIEVANKFQEEKSNLFNHSSINQTASYSCNSIKFSNFDDKFSFGPFNNVINDSNEELLLLGRVKRKIYIAGVTHSIIQLLTKNKSSENIGMKSALDELNILDYLLCGPNTPKLMSQVHSLINDGRKKSRESEETMEPGGAKYIVQEPEWENDTTVFCNEFMRKLESSYSTRVLFRIFKPFIRGKLIYTPDAPVINRIMARINKVLSQVKMIIDLIKNSNEGPAEFNNLKFEDLVNKFKNEESFLLKMIESNIGKIIFKNFENETFDENKTVENAKLKVKKLLKSLDETIDRWKSLVQNFNNANNFSTLIPYLECIDLERIISVRDEESAVKEALYWLNRERLWGLIVFNNISSDSEALPPSLTYKIRTDIERTPATNRIKDRIYIPKVKRNIIYDLREITGGFAYLQNIIEGELIREYTGREHVPGIYLQQTPFPCHIYDSFRDVITRTFPMFMVISWIYIFCMISKRIVAEKEILFKGTLRVFGVTNAQHWISWFLDAFAPMVIATSIISVLLVMGGLIPNSSIFVIWMFLTAFTLPTITLAFMVSTFFFKSSLAMAVSGMVYFLLYLPYPPIQNFGEALDPNFKILACLISNVGFGLGCTWIANMEEIGIGAQLSFINYSPVPGNPITMSLIIEMFLVDSLIYLLIAIYFDNVLQASDFVKQPWYYCLTLSYWKSSLNKEAYDHQSFDQRPEKNDKYFESEPRGVRVGIEVVNLSKVFGKGAKKKKVVKNLTINFYEDQITSFLGHNGAGKTTTVSMMIGLLPITEGAVRIYGVNIKNNPCGAIKDIGICRQENVLLNDLTVEEHFKLFARLKIHSREEVENETKKLIEDLQLGYRAKQPVKILSGGMKRKVCVAMAFIGGSRTVFLDEPTAGIDPYARRSIWELLVKYKKGRTIILTTHFLDEADILGDRIAIISSGELKCCGSSIFLKSNFGRGYYLTIESNIRSIKGIGGFKKLTEDSRLSTQVQELSNLIKNVIPTAIFLEQIGSEIVFILPSHVSPDIYSKLFTELNNRQEELNFSSFGVTDTSLEEVFTKILTEAEENENIAKKLVPNPVAPSADKTEILEYDNMTREKGVSEKIRNRNVKSVIKEHFTALFVKRFLHHIRNFKILLIEILLPTMFMAIALELARTLPMVSEMPPLVIDISAYSSSSIFYTNEFPNNPRIASYERVLLGPYTLGTQCVLYPEECSMRSIPEGSLIANGSVEDTKNCSCPKGFFECNANQSLQKPPSANTSQGIILYNLTGLNLTNWLLTTEFEDSAHRLGGISLGYSAPFTGMSIRDFVNLFMFGKFIRILEKFVVEDNVVIDPDIFTLLVMSTSCNKSFGQEFFRNKNIEDNVIIWFNNRGLIASLALMNSVTNLVLRASLPNGSDPSKYSIRLINHPLPITKRQLEDQIELQTNIALVCALSVIWALSFIPAMYAVYLVEENISGLKNLEIISGLSRTVYWCTNLVWDMISYSVSILAIIFLYYLFHMSAFVGQDAIGTFVVLLYSYGFVNITFVYMISFGFSVSSTAFIFIACWNILSGVTTLLATFTLTLISSKEDPYYLNTVSTIFPQFCLGKSLVNMALEDIRKKSLKDFGIKTISKFFEWNFTLKYIVIMLVCGILFFLITLLIEYQFLQKYVIYKFIWKKLLKGRKTPLLKDNYKKSEDEDVKKERDRVESGKAKEDSDVLIINNLTKVYSTRESPAVDHICVGIKRGECFGLLGLNGAGKTTVFKMLTGCISPTEGDATIKGFSIKTDSSKTGLLIGYCPQVNALDPYLTVNEHLAFFCRIRGVTGLRREREISFNIERLGLSGLKDKIVKKLSGGNKRKVNTAIALVCNPELVLLDEPTSGMDVLSKRFLWNCLQDVVLEGRCVILTSHSMEECQALCTRLSIMVNGQFSCFGSCQHLKNKFNDGYSVVIRLFNVSDIENVMSFVETNLHNSSLQYVHHKQIRYKLSPNIFIGTVFEIMSRAKEEKLIQDYSITQTTLESIFLKLAANARSVPQEPKFKLLKQFCCNFCHKVPEVR